jgi:type II secretory pathway component GspD/PulD (secretin)
MKRPLLILILLTAAVCLSAPARLPPTLLQHKVSFDLTDVGLANAFKIISEVSHQEFRVAPSLEKVKVSLKFKDATVQSVLDALATKYDLHYVNEGGVVRVEPAPRHEVR